MSTPTADRSSSATAKSESSYDLERLERAVDALVERNQEIAGENAALQGRLEEREQTLRSLELRVGEMSQRREDALKRLDELIERVATLEARSKAADR